MVPNGSAYSNFPAFANNGTKTPPGGSTESAKYALGMVPADTFPAEWANYLFHGATAGITRLNQDTGSIKKEINSVLSNFNITPDATLNNQLLEALNKLKAEAALAAHPVHSLYWTASDDNPAVTFGGGTWVQIKDRFILAAGDTYTNGATGGFATVTLTENEMPSHYHSYTPEGSISGGSYSFIGTTFSSNLGDIRLINPHSAGGFGYPIDDVRPIGGNVDAKVYTITYDITPAGTISVTTNPTFSGTDSTTLSKGNGAAHENMPPYAVKYCWERTA